MLLRAACHEVKDGREEKKLRIKGRDELGGEGTHWMVWKAG